jgi:uncharacterized membrane-anchored protein
MSTWSNTTKNTETFTNQTKNSVTLTNQTKSHNSIGYILTDALDYVLLGQNSDEVLIWDTPTEWSNLTKS